MKSLESILMVSDSANAAYADEQAKREQRQDDSAEAWDEAVLSIKELIEQWGLPALQAALSLLPKQYSPVSVPPVVCSECENWRASRLLHLADGSTRNTPGFCTARAAADLPQVSQHYAQQCQLFEHHMPF